MLRGIIVGVGFCVYAVFLGVLLAVYGVDAWALGIAACIGTLMYTAGLMSDD